MHNPHGGGNTYVLERALDEDLLLTSVGWANSYYATETLSQDGLTYTDEWGVRWRNAPYETAFGAGHYTEMIGHPLADDAAIDSYVPPDPNRPELYAEAARVIREFKDEYWIVGVTVTTIWETAWALRGYQRALEDLALNPELIDRILEIPYQYHLTAAKKLVEMGVDMIWLGDDVGAQNKMLISPSMWRRMLKPRMATFIAELKRINPAIKIAYHSDGNILPIIPDLIEIGLDVLNPLQPQSMDPAEIAAACTATNCASGARSTSNTPCPSARRPRSRLRCALRLQTVGKNGGLILGPTHHVQLDTPMENFWAMVHSIRTMNAEC